MDLQLNGRRALVTGSSSGIGVAIAAMLVQEGCRVVVHGRNESRARQVAAEIGAEAAAIGDLSADESAASVHDHARAALGGSIEILVNNAGGTDSATTPPLEISVAQWLAQYQGNTLAAVRMTQHALPDMIAGKWGRVIQISSAVALQPNNLGLDYSAAKAALNNYTASLAGSLHGAGVTVNTVTPGVIMMETLLEWGRSQFGRDLSVEEVTRSMADAKIFDLPPAGRLGTPEDIALVVCMLASPRSGFVTGSNYRVDGGQVRAVI